MPSSSSSYSPGKEKRKRATQIKRRKRVPKKELGQKTSKKNKKDKTFEVNIEDEVTHGIGTSHSMPTNEPMDWILDDISSSSSDKSYIQPERKIRINKAMCEKKRRDNDKVADKSDKERQRRYVQVHFIDTMNPSDDGPNLPNPEIRPASTIGPMENECFHCGALHFAGNMTCCTAGKIFVPPFAKLPEPLQSLLHGERNKTTNHFKEEIVKYNSTFSFASVQYCRNPVAAFGVQAVRAQGSVRHYTSAVLPNENRQPAFGNLYVYQGEEAIKKRMQNPIAKSLKVEILGLLTDLLENKNAFAKMYYSMNQKIEELKRTGGEVEKLRLKIVDSKKVNKDTLQAHIGVYGSEHVHSNYLAVFYTASVEQQMNVPGLVVYPKHGFHISRPIFYWSHLINPLCYPLLFPYGEACWNNKQFKYCKNRMSFMDRLHHYAHQHPAEAADWDTPMGGNRFRITQDPNVEESSLESEEDDNLSDNEYNQQMDDVAFNEEQEQDEQEPAIAFEERGGDLYPTRVTEISRRRHSEDDIDSDVSENEENGDEEDIIGQDLIEEEEQAQVAEQPHEVEQVHPKHRLFVTLREWMLYVMQQRNLFKNRFTSAGKLGQLFLIDNCTRILQSRADEIREHHTEFMSSTKAKFLEAMQRRIERTGRRIGCITSIPSNVPGSPRYLQQKYEDTVALANKYGPADLFITFTANVNWKEIKESIPRGLTWADFPFLVNEVFWKKFEYFKEIVLGKQQSGGCRNRFKGLFGQVLWYTYSVEFQQRGPPHVHMIVSLVDHIHNVADVDKICQAVIPPMPNESDPQFDEKMRFRDLVTDLMIHRPCENDPEAYCQAGKPKHWKTCRKHFPKEFSNETIWGDLVYPELKRPNNKEFCVKTADRKKYIADNRHVVAYNTQLLTMFESHCNVEIVTSLRSVKYTFKYLFKGFDRILVETITSNSNQVKAGDLTVDGHIMYPSSLPLTKEIIQQRNQEARNFMSRNNVPLKDQNNQAILVYDETHFVEDLRSLTSCEAAWIISAYPRTGCSHSVITVFVHEPYEEPIHYGMGQEEIELEYLQAEEVHSRLKSWFDLNRFDEFARTLTFNELPMHYRYRNGIWIRRRINLTNTFGRIKAVHPRNLQLYAIRLLVAKRKGITSFKDLRTVDGDELATFVDAAKALRLMNDQMEWDFALEEASRDKMPIHLRRLFASILLFCAPLYPLGLWLKYKEHFIEIRREWSEESKEAHALHHIESILKRHGTSLRKFGLPEVSSQDLPETGLIDDDTESISYSPFSSTRIAEEMYGRMNAEQKSVFDRIFDSISNNRRTSFFMNGSGGCGKTFVYKALFHKLSSANFKVLCVAHTGIAANLLPHGMTAHRAFSIPLEVSTEMLCNVEQESPLAAELSKINVVLWDEACMTDHRIFQAVHKLLCSFHTDNTRDLFGGVSFVLGGDWKQTLPIVPDVWGEGVEAYTILRSQLWQRIKVLHLTENIRARSDPAFAEWLLDVGNGINIDTTLPENQQQVQLPKCILRSSENEVIQELFGNGKITDPEAANTAILTVDNATTLELNDKILKLLDGPEKTYESIDTFDETKGFRDLDPEVYNQMLPKGMPPHILKLKVGAIVMLLRNMDVDSGLCNGTRLRVLMLGENVITCAPLFKERGSPERVYLTRQHLTSSSKASSRELAFIRLQYPIRLSYAMTINKSQGQTLAKAGIILRSPCFSHGQLFVALSRVRRLIDLCVFNIEKDRANCTNVVYKNILHLL